MVPTYRECRKCGKIDFLKNFTNNRDCTYKKGHTCKSCSNKRSQEWVARNPEKSRKTKRSQNLKRFGMTEHDFGLMLISQNGVCAICRQPETATRKGVLKKLAIDHCHSTGLIRGLLCARCNVTLGNMNDSPAMLRVAAEYLEKASHAGG